MYSVTRYHFMRGGSMLKKICASLVALGMVTQAFAGFMSPRQAIYYHANKGNLFALQKLKSMGHSIDISDEYGNSALCESVYRSDYSAFAILKQIGASTTHPCVNKIPPQTVQQFNQGYASWAQEVNSGKIAYAGASAQAAPEAAATTVPPAQTTTVASTAAETGTTKVATETGLSTAAWVGIGVGAAALIGGGIALAAGGGGGGSSSAPAVCSGHGSKNDEGNCVCDTGYTEEDCSACASNYGKYGTNSCHLTKGCNTSHGSQKGDSCVCNTGWTGDEVCNTATTCGTNYVASCPTGYTHSKTCKSGDSTLYLCDTCASNYKKIGGVCVAEMNCNNGTQTGDNVCTCNEGYDPSTNCSSCDSTHTLIGGVCVTKLACKNGSSQVSATQCSCKNLWSGSLCDTCPISGEHVTDCACDSGYTRSGSACVDSTTISCTTSQYWNGSSCTSCPANSASAGGSAETCDCNSGFTNLGNANTACFAITDCNGHGTQTGAGKCSCTDGYTGDLCETAPISCTTSQYYNGISCQACLNGGTSTGGNASACSCSGNWTGTDCGTCKLSGNGVTSSCTCSSGYALSGTTCIEQPEDTNGYLLIGDTYVKDPTACPADHFGMAPACHECPTNSHSVAGTRTAEGCICEEGKVCTLSLHSDCPSGQVAVADECYSQGSCPTGYIDMNGDCMKAGSCSSDEINFFGLCFSQGSCPDGQISFYGYCLNITDLIDPGEPGPELPNDSICGRHGAYSQLTKTCICTEGYTGSTCNIPPTTNACTNTSCGEHGVCNIKTGACECKGGYSGTTCNVAPKALASASLASLNSKISTLSLNLGGVSSKTVSAAGSGDLIGKVGTDDGDYSIHNGATISLNNTQDRNVYGFYWNGGEIAAEMTNSGDGNGSDGLISITNKSDKNVYGMWGDGIDYMDNASAGDGGQIIIDNEGNGDVYGMWATGEDYFYNMCISWAYTDGTGLVSIKNKGDGDVYGVHSEGGKDDGFIDVAWAGRGMLDIYNEGNGNVYGLFGDKNVHTVYADDITEYLNSQGIIQITNTGSGNSYALFGNNAHLVSNETLIAKGASMPYANNAIYMTNTGSGTAVGMYNNGEAIYNSGIITINNTGTGSAIGIFSAGDNTNVLNSGTITLNNTSNANLAVGIYAKGGNVVNTGSIIVNGTENAYGIYAENGATVYNTGSIQIGDYVYKGNGALENFIYLNGASLVNAGKLSASSINFDKTGGDVIAKSNAKFISQNEMTGKLNISSDIVKNGFNTTYTEKDMIQAGDASGLKLISDSALFDAKLAENGKDVVMTMKSFDEVTKNKSLSAFLSKNYALGNNEGFYNKLKSFGNMSGLTDSLNKLTGKEMLSRFNFEDMTMMRELNFDMNEKLFHNKEQHFALAGSVSPMAFKGDTGSNARYSLYNKRNGNTSIGLGVAFTEVRSDDENENNNRSETSYQLILPIGYKTHGFNLITSPRMGYARGSYDRTGFDNKTYDGTIEKRVFGLMNEARYPITLGKWKFEPSAEFNILGYQQKGHEEAKEFALNIRNQNTYSVEGGIGLYATRTKELDKDTMFKMTAGISAYHEFADPYKLRVGMEGMNGNFTLRDENRSDNRGVMRAGFDYVKDNYSLYGSFLSYIDKQYRTIAKTGFMWKF